MRSRLGLASLAVMAATLVAAPAHALSFADIAGKWCTEAGSSQFTPNTIIVRKANGTRLDLKIDHYAYTDTMITVFWVRLTDHGITSTDYGDFSADGRRMAQLVSHDGPRREHHRC